MTTYTYCQDPGHGWLAVPFADLRALGLSPADFSTYSYRKGDVAFLEEDCDMAIFMEAYRARHGAYPDLEDDYREKTPIRGYRSIWDPRRFGEDR